MKNLDVEEPYDNQKEEPVFYCKKCLSLDIRHIPELTGSEYCDKCGSTSIENCTIEEWENLYKNKYGHKFLEEY